MPYSNEKPGAGAAIIYDEPHYSRDQVTVPAGITIKPNAPLGMITASKKFVPLNPAASDGSEVYAGHSLYGIAVSAGGSDGKMAAIRRHARLNKAETDWGTLTTPQINTAITQAAALGIIIEDSI